MPEPPVPSEIDAFLRRPNPGRDRHAAPDGSPHTVATWYDWEDGRALVNMEVTRLRLQFMRRDPRVSLTALAEERLVRARQPARTRVSLEDDPDLVDIDRLARRYTGNPFRRRDAQRVSAWIEVDRWHAWD